MLLSVVVNLGMLGYFKYGDVPAREFPARWSRRSASTTSRRDFDIVLPVGISFYTFATLSYTLDVYLRRAAPARNFLDYALFVTFFPHLVAGPIMRPTELVPQFADAAPRDARPAALRPRADDARPVPEGRARRRLPRAAGGDGLRRQQDARARSMRGSRTLAFSGQIFCDFAGYSTTAIGAALCLGFAMPDNFRFPYAAIGFSDFWRRWHITLSSWLRDYLYIPLGGNRHGEARTYFALMTTMLLGGLWHGASWTFVVWGGLHGLYLVGRARAAQALRRLSARDRSRCSALGLLTYALINVTWVFFRAKTFGKAWSVLQRHVRLQRRAVADPAAGASRRGRADRRRHRVRALAACASARSKPRSRARRRR